MTICNVFYSWQSDLPNATNRGLIQEALENAAKAIRDDNSIQIEPVVDRDTAGVPGAPDIAETIFTKIDRSQIFVCDVSIVNSRSKRLCPNPNVLIELGFARKALGSDRIVMVMNTSFGGPELLPFDLRQRRVVTYSNAETDPRSPERKKLEAKLQEALRNIILTLEKQPAIDNLVVQISEQARMAIENSAPNQKLQTNRLLDVIWKTIDKIAPEFPGSRQELTDDTLIRAITDAIPAVMEFARLTDIIAAMNALEPARAVYDGFGHLLKHYRPPEKFSGSFYSTHADYYKFLGHELFVTLIAHLIRDSRWSILTELLDEPIYVENTPYGNGQVRFQEISDNVVLLEERGRRLSPERVSLHADLLNERHTKEPLEEIISMKDFVDADFFLFLREGLEWQGWSTIHMEHRVPRFLIESRSIKTAHQLMPPLKVSTVDELKKLVVERIPSLRQLFRHSSYFFPLEYFGIDTIGSV